jgi:hypothetical protein
VALGKLPRKAIYKDRVTYVHVQRADKAQGVADMITQRQRQLHERFYNASTLSKAGAEIWSLYNHLGDDYDDEEIFSKLDAHIADCSKEANALYLLLAK